MADKSTSSVRALAPSERDAVIKSLELRAKSEERAARASDNSVIAQEHTKEAALCRNLCTELRNGVLGL